MAAQTLRPELLPLCRFDTVSCRVEERYSTAHASGRLVFTPFIANRDPSHGLFRTGCKACLTAELAENAEENTFFSAVSARSAVKKKPNNNRGLPGEESRPFVR